MRANTDIDVAPWSAEASLQGGEYVASSESGRILVVEDDPALLRLWSLMLRSLGHEVDSASDGAAAIACFRRQPCDVVVSDVSMPRMSGLQLLEEIRQHDADVPVILITGAPEIAGASKAVEFGAFRYLPKPVPLDAFRTVVGQAVAVCRAARVRRQVLEGGGAISQEARERAAMTAKFESALKQLWIAYQPIIRWSTREIFAYEALVRSQEEALRDPESLFGAAERLGRVRHLGRAIRGATPAPMASTQSLLFVNLTPRDLEDDDLLASGSALAGIAQGTVLEITERAPLDDIPDVRERLATLRRMGFRLALDDVGSGYSGLNSFAILEPEVVKLDMLLVRDVQESDTKQRLIHSMVSLCKELGATIIAEGVETPQELVTLIDLGCDHFQGYLFARPAPAFPVVNWEAADEVLAPGVLRVIPS